jgi:carbohydrate esterase-like sialic acid-specific acetylesterase
VSIGRGQSGLTAGVCRSFRKGGLLYDHVMGPAMELKGKVTFGGIWTMFGQSEVNDASNTTRFGECMAGLANDMRTDLGEPELPFLVGDWEEGTRGSLSIMSSAAKTIIPQIRALPMQVTRSLVIPTDGLPMNPLDNQHYDLTGYKMWAERGVALLKMNGWAAWAP